MNLEYIYQKGSQVFGTFYRATKIKTMYLFSYFVINIDYIRAREKTSPSQCQWIEANVHLECAEPDVKYFERVFFMIYPFNYFNNLSPYFCPLDLSCY